MAWREHGKKYEAAMDICDTMLDDGFATSDVMRLMLPKHDRKAIENALDQMRRDGTLRHEGAKWYWNPIQRD